MDIHVYWDAVLRQDVGAIAGFFAEDAKINWRNTNECFTVSEFIRANCEYPGQWDGKVEKVMALGDQVITVTHVYNKERTISCHAVSFLHIKENKILFIDEYWGDDGPPPQWRQDMFIGRSLSEESKQCM